MKVSHWFPLVKLITVLHSENIYSDQCPRFVYRKPVQIVSSAGIFEKVCTNSDLYRNFRKFYKTSTFCRRFTKILHRFCHLQKFCRNSVVHFSAQILQNFRTFFLLGLILIFFLVSWLSKVKFTSSGNILENIKQTIKFNHLFDMLYHTNFIIVST